MSDTLESAVPESAPPAPALPPVRNFSVKAVSGIHLGQPATFYEVTYGEPVRTMQLRALDMGDQWDLAELTGNVENALWSGMASIAASVLKVDEIPVPRMPGANGEVLDKRRMRHTLRSIGMEGMRAAQQALADVDGTAGVPRGAVPDMDVAKN